MWYFSWILGLGLAASVGMWHELQAADLDLKAAPNKARRP